MSTPRPGTTQFRRLLRADRADFIRTSRPADGATPLTNRRLHNALAAVLDLAMRITDADSGSVQLRDPLDGSLRLVAHERFTDEAAQFFRVVKDDRSCCHAALTRGRRTVVPDVAVSPLYTEPARDVMLRAHLRACQSTPIRGRNGHVIGMISTLFRTPHRATAQQLRRMDVLARHAAFLIEHRPQRVVSTNPSAIIEDYREARSEKMRAISR